MHNNLNNIRVQQNPIYNSYSNGRAAEYDNDLTRRASLSNMVKP